MKYGSGLNFEDSRQILYVNTVCIIFMWKVLFQRHGIPEKFPEWIVMVPVYIMHKIFI